MKISYPKPVEENWPKMKVVCIHFGGDGENVLWFRWNWRNAQFEMCAYDPETVGPDEWKMMDWSVIQDNNDLSTASRKEMREIVEALAKLFT